MITTERNIGRNKGKPRLWIEGAALEQAGLPHGSAWVLVSHLTGLDIARVDAEPGSTLDGRRVRKIAGTASRPVIDIAGASLAPLESVHGMAERVSLSFEPGSGFIAVRDATGRNE
jgi:hypothetical protein